MPVLSVRCPPSCYPSTRSGTGKKVTSTDNSFQNDFAYDGPRPYFFSIARTRSSGIASTVVPRPLTVVARNNEL